MCSCVGFLGTVGQDPTQKGTQQPSTEAPEPSLRAGWLCEEKGPQQGGHGEQVWEACWGPPSWGCCPSSLQVPTKCEPGCVCAEGLYEDASGQCVPPEECPCEYAGVSYPRGAELHADCKSW